MSKRPAKANLALAAVFPLMILLMLTVIMVQVRNFRGLAMVFLTAPLGLIGAAPTLLLFDQPFGFNAILGLIGLAGILMRNTLILIGQIDADLKAGLDPREAVIEATVRRSRPVRAHRGRRRAGLHTADLLQLLGSAGVHPDRRRECRHAAHPAVPARALFPLLPRRPRREGATGPSEPGCRGEVG